jgi:hypothetical protein
MAPGLFAVYGLSRKERTMQSLDTAIWARYRRIVVEAYTRLRWGGWDHPSTVAYITARYGTTGAELLEGVLA